MLAKWIERSIEHSWKWSFSTVWKGWPTACWWREGKSVSCIFHLFVFSFALSLLVPICFHNNCSLCFSWWHSRYQIAEDIDGQLNQMSTTLKDLVTKLNRTHEAVDHDSPVTYLTYPYNFYQHFGEFSTFLTWKGLPSCSNFKCPFEFSTMDWPNFCAGAHKGEPPPRLKFMPFSLFVPLRFEHRCRLNLFTLYHR